MIEIKKLTESSILPFKGSVNSAGYDLCSIESYELKPQERKLFKTGLALSIPVGQYGRIAPRSGLSFKNGIDVMAGVIDSDYTGEIMVLLINLGQEPVNIKQNDKIAQIIFENHNNHEFVIVDELNKTDRANGGFGSTDNKNLKELFANKFTNNNRYSDTVKEK